MRVRSLIGTVSLLQLYRAVCALPTEQQQPLQSNGSPDVQAVQAALREAEIIPTVIDDFLPSLTLSVSWEKGEASLGNTIKPKHLQDPPSITLHEDISPGISDTHPTYVITLTDPDAPSRQNPKWSEMCHWIATNVSVTPRTFSILPLPEHGLVEQEISEQTGPDDVIEYKPPGPPPKTGKHRYVFLVFAPRNGTTEPLHLSKPEDRQHWGGEKEGGVRDWAEANKLVPVAANFVYSKSKKQ